LEDKVSEVIKLVDSIYEQVYEMEQKLRPERTIEAYSAQLAFSAAMRHLNEASDQLRRARIQLQLAEYRREGDAQVD